MSLKRLSTAIAAASLIAAAIACNTPGVPASTPTLTATPTPLTGFPTAQPGILSPTAPVATSIPAGQPTTAATPAPIPTKAPVVPTAITAKRVSFETAATQATVTGSLAANASESYALRIMGGQLLEVSSTGAAQPQITVSGADGTPVQSGTLIRRVVPTDQDYIVRVSAGAQAIDYSLLIVIPQRITFEKGATEDSLRASVAPNSTRHYVINLQAGQLAQFLFSTEDGIHTIVYGVDGAVLKSGTSEGANFHGIVPSTQDYVLAVVGSAKPVPYTLRTVVPVRLSFPAGATWMDLQGTLQASQNFHYVMDLAQGQALEVMPIAANSPALTVTGVDGKAVENGSGRNDFFWGHLPANGDYVLTLTGGDQTASYHLSVIAPARVSFAAGASSATLTGSLDPHETIYYSVQGKKGQTLDALFTPEKTAKMTIYGIDGTVLWSGMGEGTRWTGALPLDEDYFIVFQAGDKAVDYTLKVTIT